MAIFDGLGRRAEVSIEAVSAYFSSESIGSNTVAVLNICRADLVIEQVWSIRIFVIL